MRKQIITALKFLVLMTIITGLLYPVIVTLTANLFFRKEAMGSLVERDGLIIGSELIGQNFNKDKYFWSRPSATDYNPLPSGASNHGPMNPVLLERITEREEAFLIFNYIGKGSAISPEIVTASASGLDPHITPESALAQVKRVVKARGLDEVKEDQIIDLINNMTEKRQFSLFGEPRINVFLLNLKIDSLK